MKTHSFVFKEYFSMPASLDDRLIQTNEKGIDVIIPLLNTNELFERNLHSIYKEIPVNRLLIGDGGCTDGSIEIAQKFPRVVVLNQKGYVSQGFAIKELMESVETENFIYLHADVFLTEGWYNEMEKHLTEFDWFECPQRLTVMVEFWNNMGQDVERSYSGAQMGKKKMFDKITPIIEDDFLQRNEDIIFSELVENAGGKYGKIKSAFHYHQVMSRRGETEPKFKSVNIQKVNDRNWEVRIFDMQAKGIIKYLNPTKKYLIDEVNDSLKILHRYKEINDNELWEWIKKTNPAWLPYIKYKDSAKDKFVRLLKRIIK
jgi:hypothetical protein